MKNLLISFEGIDGCGKSTQAKLLLNYFQSLGRTVSLHREPGGTDIGERIRDILLDANHTEMSPYTELLLYLSARAQITSQIIIPALSRNEDVIMDRFMDSSTAYQGYARGLGIECVQRLNLIATQGIIPDVTFVIDCDPAISLNRLSLKPDRLESEGIAFMMKVREGFIDLCHRESKRMVLINGERQIGVIEEDIKRHIDAMVTSL